MKYLYTSLCIIGGMFLPFFLQAQPVADFSSNLTSGCPPIVVQFTDQSTGNPTSWSWNLGNGTVSNLKNPSTTYIVPGMYTVTLTVANANGSNTKTLTNYIKVAPAPAVSFVADSSISCAPKTIQFTNLSVPGGNGTPSYLWDFGDGNTSTLQNPAHTYNTQGNYKVSLVITNSNGCTQTLTKNNYIKLVQKPVINFTATNTSSCKVPVTINFTNGTTGGSSYFWDFGDGTSSTQQTPSHTYTTTGNYNVKLVVTNASGCKDSIIKTAFVKAGILKASFISTSSLCVGNSMTFTNTTVQAANSYTWQFGNGASSATAGVQYTYPAAGTYTARLIADYGICKDTASKTITVNPKPALQFATNKATFCSLPATVQFSNTTSGASSYTWQFGNGNTATQQSPSYTYTAAGNYTVKLIATSANGCTDSLKKTDLIKIQIPTATLTATPAAGCLPATPVFTATITANEPITSYNWNFGDGTTSSCSSCATTQHTYNAAGTYTVTLTYTTATGCSKTVQTTVKYGTKPTAAFTESATNLCPGQAVSFTNGSIGATSYAWNFGEGNGSSQGSPTNIYNITGVYTVRLIADNNGCKDTAIKTNLINVKLPRARFSVPYSCANRLSFTFQDLSAGADTYLWNFGDGSTSTTKGNVTHTYQAYGIYTVTLTVTNAATGCTHTITQTVNTYPITPQFTAQNTSMCKGEAVTFTATASNNYASYTYNYGDGVTNTARSETRSYTYPATGQYTVRLIVTDKNGCKDSISKTNYIKVNGATANFTATPAAGCAPLQVNFQDQSITYGGAITSRSWTFGNGNTSTTASASQLYSANGLYTVKLKVTDANGCKDSLTKTNFISVTKPQAAFKTTDTNICGGQNATFVNTSTGSSLSSKWYFGDGNTGGQTNGIHAYNTAGMYNVKLVVTDINGCKDSATKPSVVKVSVPEPSFALSDTFASCPPLTVNFTNTSTGSANYSWNFGNGSQSVLPTPATVFTYPGNYTIKLKGYTTNGCVDSATRTVKILGPTGTFSYNAIGCSPLTVQFSAVTNNTTAYIWDMNDGMTKNTSTPAVTYTYTQSGKFVPKLILSDGASCMVPIQGTDTVMADKVKGDFSFISNTLCQTGTVQFKDTVNSSIFPVTTRNWNFGDGATSTAHNPSHTYAAPGTYQVKLLLGNSKGCQDTIIKTITVHSAPSVSAGNNISVCQGQATPVTLHAAGAASYIWTPAANLSCSTCASPVVLSNVPATYTVIGTDTNGCKDTATVAMSHYPVPQVNAGTDVAICKGLSATLQATGAATYSWSPAIGLSCTSCASPVATPAATTTYVVTGVNSNGCIAVDTITVIVNDYPLVDAGAGQSVCIGSSAQLQATGASTYNWSPAVGLSCTSCSNPLAMPTATTTYTVVGTSAQGCSDTDIVVIKVNPLPVVSAPSYAVCQGDSIQLSAKGALTYHWSPAASLSCDNCANPMASPAHTVTYHIDGTDSNGCTSTTQAIITVNALPIVNAGNDQSVCEGTLVQLHATGAVSYTWSPATALSCTNCASPIASPSATTSYTVTGVNANGCTDTDTIIITVNKKPAVNARTDKKICAGSSVQLLAAGTASYSWSPATGLSCTSCSNPVAAPAATTTYTVVGIDANGCSDTDEVLITINSLPVLSAPAQSVCKGDSVQLSVTGAAIYNWSPATGLSCTNCADPIAGPLTTTMYTITGTDSNGCVATVQTTVTVKQLPVVNAGADTSVCDGSSVTLSATGADSYVWSPAIGLSCTNCPQTDASPSGAVSYIVTGTLNGCSAADTVKVKVYANPHISAGKDVTICAGESVKLKASIDQNCSWTAAHGISCTTCTDPVVSPITTTVYTVSTTDSNGCSANDQVTVKVNPLPVVDAGTDKEVCENAQVSLHVKGADKYEWSPALGLSCTDCSNPLAGPVANIVYKVKGIDANGCQDSDEVAITIIERKPTETGIGDTICKGASVQLSAKGGTAYDWYPAIGLNNTSTADPVATPDFTTTYQVLVYQNACFTDTHQVTIVVNENPVVNAGEDIHGSGGNVQLHAAGNGIVKYEWLDTSGLSCTDCASPVSAAKQTTNYKVVAYNEWGCKAEDDVTVFVSCDQSNLFVANTFTPNGDGQNDRFYPQGKGLKNVKRFRVFNRWGELMFDMPDMPLNAEQYGWDGTYKGQSLKPDVFVYILNTICESGEPIEMKGDISLVR